MTACCHGPAQARSLQHEAGGSLWQRPGGRAGALRRAAQRRGRRLCPPAASQLRVRTEPVRAPLSHTPGVSLQRKPAGGGAGGDGHAALSPQGARTQAGSRDACPPAQKAGNTPAGRPPGRGRLRVRVCTRANCTCPHDTAGVGARAGEGGTRCEHPPNPWENQEAQCLPDLGLAREQR